MLKALTRELSPRIVECELTHLAREPIDFGRAVKQHDEYEKTLRSLGCVIERLPSLPDNADAVFVEDTAVVLRELAIISRPGAMSRRNEISSVADALQSYRPLRFIEEPGTVDGGDVLVIGSTIYVGRSTRTNAEGIAQLSALADGYTVQPVTVTGCLHLKSAVTALAEDCVLLNPEWIDASHFSRMRIIEVDPAEPSGANALTIGTSVVYPANFNATRARLEREGMIVHQVQMDELQKAEGAVTCCSIVLEC